MKAGTHAVTYKAKCSVLFEHLYESYQGDGESVFSVAG